MNPNFNSSSMKMSIVATALIGFTSYIVYSQYSRKQSMKNGNRTRETLSDNEEEKENITAIRKESEIDSPKEDLMNGSILEDKVETDEGEEGLSVDQPPAPNVYLSDIAEQEATREFSDEFVDNIVGSSVEIMQRNMEDDYVSQLKQKQQQQSSNKDMDSMVQSKKHVSFEETVSRGILESIITGAVDRKREIDESFEMKTHDTNETLESLHVEEEGNELQGLLDESNASSDSYGTISDAVDGYETAVMDSDSEDVQVCCTKQPHILNEDKEELPPMSMEIDVDEFQECISEVCNNFVDNEHENNNQVDSETFRSETLATGSKLADFQPELSVEIVDGNVEEGRKSPTNNHEDFLPKVQNEAGTQKSSNRKRNKSRRGRSRSNKGKYKTKSS